jgi:diamine N-acetyltransferase
MNASRASTLRAKSHERSDIVKFMDTIVRLAKTDDLKRVQELNHQLFLSDARHFDDLNTNWPYEEGEAYFRKRIAGEGGVCFVAEKDDEIIGYVMGGWSHLNFSAYKGKRAELENICVDEKARSHGTGALLVNVLFDWCKDNGASYVMVDAYAPNLRAIKFYETLGFEPYSNVLWHQL